ncbi:MAG: energy-coupling factor transporter transmembrane component T [Acutalibacteraceae bacterium]|jgi:energy-coupling factor transport system permease protein
MNTFASYHPAVLMLYFIAVLLIAMFTQNPVLLALALLGGVSFCTLLERPKDFLHNMAFYIPLFLMIAITNPLFSHNGVTPLFFLNGNPVTLEAVLYGLDIAAMLVAVMYWFKCYNHIMTSEKILFLFGKVIPKLSLLLSTALRFVPLFKAQIKKIHQAQKAMGLYASNSYVDKLRSAVRVFSAMLTWSLENAIDTGSSMKARGYGLKGRSHFALFRFTARDGLLSGAAVFLLALVLLGTALKETAFSFYPRITALSASPIAILAYLAFGLLVFLPFLLEIVENMRWKALLSSIPKHGALSLSDATPGKDDKK